MESYRYLRFYFHVTKQGGSHLVSAATKAVHAIKQRCAHLQIDDAMQAVQQFGVTNKSHASEVWAVNLKPGEDAEMLHRQLFQSNSCMLGTAQRLRLCLQDLANTHCRWQQI